MSSLSDKSFGPDEIAKLKKIVEEGVNISQEVNDLKEGLKEAVKSIAEELDIKPALINKAINAAVKATLDEEKDKLNDVEEILSIVGRR